MTTSYVPLEGNFTGAVGVKAPSFSGDTPSLFTSTSFLYTLFFVIIILTASSRYLIASLWRMEGTTGSIKKSNDEFKRVTIGLLGVLSLWLILSTVNKDMLTGDVGLGAFKATPSSASTKNNTKTNTSGMDNPKIPTNNDDPKGWDAIKNDSTIRAQLNAQGITVNKRVCNNPTQTSCTTVGGWPAETVSMLTQLRKDCSGEIEVTGGNEAGHSSHGPGLSPVDLSMNKPGNLNDCIKAFPQGPAKSFCKKTYIKYGYIFCDENLGVVHWHVYK